MGWQRQPQAAPPGGRKAGRKDAEQNEQWRKPGASFARLGAVVSADSAVLFSAGLFAAARTLRVAAYAAHGA
jgi:hypothetical protein